ncbi:MAG: flavodoxin domain-containing protein [Pseudomonadota bacterium]
MHKVLVAYASDQGQTERIALRLVELLKREQLDVLLQDLDRASPSASRVAGMDGIILAASIHLGQHQTSAVNFAKAHHDNLKDKPSAFLSVSLGAGSEVEQDQEQARQQIDEFLGDCLWHPDIAVPLAGAVRYSSMSPPGRFGLSLLQRLFRRRLETHHLPDLTKDHEFTDWKAVEQFASAFAQLVEQRRTQA